MADDRVRRGVRPGVPARREGDRLPSTAGADVGLTGPPALDTLTPVAVLHLQRTAGNRVISSVLASSGTRSPAPPTGPMGLGADSAGNRRPIVAQRFEAGHHEHVEKAALTAPAGGSPGGPSTAFSEAEAHATYFGNWSRDLSQVFSNNAVVQSLGKEFLFELLNVVAMQKFGKGLQAKDFGVYSPREHMDNPAGQFDSELMQAGTAGAKLAHTGPDQFTTPPEKISDPAVIKNLFAVSEAGLPAYIGRSIQYVEEEFSTAADTGRNADGLMHFGNGLHTIEDLFAHSNWCEIAIGKLITSGKVKLGTKAQACVDERRAKGKAAINTLSARTKSGRPILTTGTFVLDDTLISVSEAISGFLKSFDPFSKGGNKERSQQTMSLILGRYETLAKEGAASKVVTSFMASLGPTLKNKLASAAEEAIAGKPVSTDAPWYKRAWGGVKEVAGAVVGGGIKLVGGAMELGWVQSAIGAAADAFGHLPLTAIYAFVMKEMNALDEWFKKLDKMLEDVPGYKTVKEFFSRQVDSLREALRVPIQAAVKFVGESIQAAFAEATVSGTNIAKQIEKSKKAIVNGPLAARLAGKSTEAQIALLQSSEFARLARLNPNGPEAQDGAKVLEQLMRIKTMEDLPPEVKAGPSHSQIAKDHADSPFFGAAATMATHVVSQLRNRMVRVWESEGKNVQDSTLKENYSDQVPADIRARRAAPGTPEEKMTPDQKEAEKEFWKKASKAKNFKEIKSLEEGRAMVAKGGIPEAEESRGGREFVHNIDDYLAGIASVADMVPGRIRALAAQVEKVAPPVAKRLRDLAASIPAGVARLEAEIEGLTTSAGAEELAERLKQLADAKAALIATVQRVLREAARDVERLDAAIASALRQLADGAEPTLRDFSAKLRVLAETVEKKLGGELTSKEQDAAIVAIDKGGGVATKAWADEFATSHARPGPGAAAMSPARAELFGLVRSVINHPEESTWWEAPLQAWCDANRERLDGYVHDANTGNMHHEHAHAH